MQRPIHEVAREMIENGIEEYWDDIFEPGRKTQNEDWMATRLMSAYPLYILGYDQEEFHAALCEELFNGFT